LRRLLFFGTGAAIIGILFLCIAFYESYLIVSTVQRQLNQSAVDTTRLLEDAALEAIFLGIMAGIGYALISLGLDGIRRQELLEAEGSAEVIFGRAQVPSRKDSPRYVARSLSAKVSSPAKREQASGLHPGIKQRAAQPNPVSRKTNMQTKPVETSLTEMDQERPSQEYAPPIPAPEAAEVETEPIVPAPAMSVAQARKERALRMAQRESDEESSGSGTDEGNRGTTETTA
jgi:hypothetical protein